MLKLIAFLGLAVVVVNCYKLPGSVYSPNEDQADAEVNKIIADTIKSLSRTKEYKGYKDNALPIIAERSDLPGETDQDLQLTEQGILASVLGSIAGKIAYDAIKKG